jgi:ribonuclease P protein component
MRRSSEFAAVVKGGRRARRGSVVVHHLPHAHAERGARIGFVVSRAVGPSTTRHRVTRQLRHLMRAELVELPADSAIVVRALPQAGTVPARVLAADLTSAVRQARRGER